MLKLTLGKDSAAVCQSFIERRDILSTALGHVRFAAAAPIDHFAGLAHEGVHVAGGFG